MCGRSTTTSLSWRLFRNSACGAGELLQMAWVSLLGRRKGEKKSNILWKKPLEASTGRLVWCFEANHPHYRTAHRWRSWLLRSVEKFFPSGPPVSFEQQAEVTNMAGFRKRKPQNPSSLKGLTDLILAGVEFVTVASKSQGH